MILSVCVGRAGGDCDAFPHKLFGQALEQMLLDGIRMSLETRTT